MNPVRRVARKLTIPLPEPFFMITVTRGGNRAQRVTVQALRFLLWVVPALSVELLLLLIGSRHSVTCALVAAFATQAIAALLVNAQAAGQQENARG